MRILTAALLFFALPLLAQKDPTSRSWNQPVEPFRIAGNVYYVGASDLTSFLITTPAGHIVLDGGFEETAPMILANIARLGFKVADVRYLLSSHAHLDHAGGLAELKRVTGATFVSSRGDQAQHARGGIGDPQFADRLPYPPIRAGRIVDEGDAVTLGGTTLTARITAGHTPGCTTWTMNVKDGAKTYSAAFLCSSSVPGNYRLVGNRLYPNIAEDYRRQFVTLRSMTPDLFLGSHGAFFRLSEKIAARGERKPNPFVDPAGFRAYVDRAEKDFESMLAKQTAAASLVLHNLEDRGSTNVVRARSERSTAGE